MSGDFLYRHHVKTRNRTCRLKNHFFPLKEIDVTRTTDTTLDVMSQKNIDDCWNVDEERDLSHAWTVFTRFTVLNEKPQAGRKRRRRHTTSRPDTLWPEIWIEMSDA